MKKCAVIFVDLFERYGYKVEEVDERSFLAEKNNICVAFSPYDGLSGAECAAVSFWSKEKDLLLDCYEKRKAVFGRFVEGLGFMAYSLWMNNRLPCKKWGNIGNHDYSSFEIETAIRH